MNTFSSPTDLVKRSFKIFFKKENFIYFLKIYSVSFVLGLISFVYSFVISSRHLVEDPGQVWVYLLPSIILFPIGIWAQASGYEAVKRAVKGEVLKFKDTYKSSWKILWRFFLVNLVVGLIVVGGVVLLIVPGIMFAVWYSFSLWGVVDKGYGVGRSLKESKLLVKGKFWRVSGRFVVFMLFVALTQILFTAFPQGYGSVTLTIFGGLFLLPYFLLYRELGSKGNI